MANTTGLNANSLTNFQLNAGVFLVGVDTSTVTSAATLKTLIAANVADTTKCLGATSGGGTFTASPKTRQIKADGMRFNFPGGTIVEEWEVLLKTTIKEITPDNMKRVIGSGDVTTVTTATTVKIRSDYALTDYISELAWVGDTIGGKYVLIRMFNALNTAGVDMKINDKGEAELNVEFRAHSPLSAINTEDFAPFEIKFLS